jgi:hypothetical protein
MRCRQNSLAEGGRSGEGLMNLATLLRAVACSAVVCAAAQTPAGAVIGASWQTVEPITCIASCYSYMLPAPGLWFVCRICGVGVVAGSITLWLYTYEWHRLYCTLLFCTAC